MLIESGSEGQGVFHRFLGSRFHHPSPFSIQKHLPPGHLPARSGILVDITPQGSSLPLPRILALRSSLRFRLSSRGLPSTAWFSCVFSRETWILLRAILGLHLARSGVTSSHPDMQFQMGKNLGRKCFTHTWCKRLLVPTS